MGRLEQLERCDAELARIAEETERGEGPAYLYVLGDEDWRRERELIDAGGG